MDMMENVLIKKIKEMQDLRQREERRDNKAAQEVTDHKFRDITTQVHELVLALLYAKKNMGFQLNDEILSGLQTIVVNQKNAIRTGYADRDTVLKVEADLKDITTTIKKEWNKRYKALTDATISTLKVISGVDSEKVAMCLNGIGKGENWTSDIEEYKTMLGSIKSAEDLINSLGLDQQIIAFLQKMNSGKATAVDLDEKVLEWLRRESLDKRVRLSFASSIRR